MLHLHSITVECVCVCVYTGCVYYIYVKVPVKHFCAVVHAVFHLAISNMALHNIVVQLLRSRHARLKLLSRPTRPNLESCIF